jgi:hypothetical protein
VRIGDGCATVTGYKLPQPLDSSETGKAGVRFQARSQDIDLAVLVTALSVRQAGRLLCSEANFSVKEKDEASPSRECVPGFADCLHSPICRGLKAFLSSGPALVSQSLTRSANLAAHLKDQPMLNVRLSVLALAGLSLVCASRAATITEDFSTDPLQNGWKIFGNTNLFQWDASNHQLAVTWDSTQPNSYFYHPLTGRLTRYDDFTFEFDLRLHDIASNVPPGKTGPMQLGIGFQNYSVATNASYLRGYLNVSDIAEFCYYPHGFYDYGSGQIYDAPPSCVPSFVSSETNASPSTLNPDYVLELPTNLVIHVIMAYTASNQTAVISVTTNGVAVGSVPGLVLNSPTNSNFAATSDYNVNMFSITSYTSIGDDYDSILAHGAVANLQVNLPPPAQNLVGTFSNGVWQVQFTDRTNWLYTLERKVDFAPWSNASLSVAGNGTTLVLQDTNTPTDHALYRIRANRP